MGGETEGWLERRSDGWRDRRIGEETDGWTIEGTVTAGTIGRKSIRLRMTLKQFKSFSDGRG